MDLDSLEQLLNCPVCFEIFDGSNRVLPCQHTFCKKCLETLKSRFKELRCPECRTKFNGYIKDLPCNIFVIRLLEQLRQAEIKTQPSTPVSPVVNQSPSTSEKEKEISHTHTKKNNKYSLPHSVVAGLSRLSIQAATKRSNENTAGFRSPDQEVPALPASTQDRDVLNGIGIRPRIEAFRRNNNNITTNSFSNPLSYLFDLPSSSNRDYVLNIPERPLTFGSNAYKFSVELKSVKRNPNSLRRVKKNHLSCCHKSTVSNAVHQNKVQTASAPEKTIHVFNPNNYSFSVELKSDVRSTGNTRRSRRNNGSIMKPPIMNVPKWI